MSGFNGTERLGTEVMIGDDKGQVVLHFKTPRFDWIMDPENARIIGVAIAKAAYKAHYGVEPPGDSIAFEMRSKATELMRQKLTNRAAVVMRSLVDNKWTPRQAAQQIVDIMMKELT